MHTHNNIKLEYNVSCTRTTIQNTVATCTAPLFPVGIYARVSCHNINAFMLDTNNDTHSGSTHMRTRTHTRRSKRK